MLTDIPYAERYFLASMIDFPLNDTNIVTVSPERVREVGGIGIMDELGKIVEDDKVVFIMGISNDRCLLFVNMTDEDCVDVITKSRISYDAKLSS